MSRILVIDDDVTSRLILREMLEDAGHEIDEAEDGRIGIDLFRENPADLVITDLIMPEKEGIETIFELRQSYPDVKIFAVSGGGTGKSTSYLNAAMKLGALHVFSKPVDPGELLDALEAVLGKDE